MNVNNPNCVAKHFKDGKYKSLKVPYSLLESRLQNIFIMFSYKLECFSTINIF